MSLVVNSLGFTATILLLLPATHGQNCGTTGTGSQFSAKAQADALAYHNTMRYNVSIGIYQANGTILGPALSMPNLTWNCTLAAEAQSWANGCVRQHDANRGYVGENLHAALTTTTQALQFYSPPDQLGYLASKNWESEFQTNVITTLVTGQYSAMLGHATQMIWSTTTQLGCGYAANCLYTDPEYPQYSYMTLVVCRYAGPGNYVGQRPYTVNCPAGKTVSSNNLTCVASSGGITPTTAKPTIKTTKAAGTTATTRTTKASVTTAAASCYAGFSTSGAQAILDAHNTIRTQVRLGTYQAKGTTLGPANGLGNLTWSCSLAAAALQYAQQNCPNFPSNVPTGTLLYAVSAPLNMNGQPYFEQTVPADGTGMAAFNWFVASLQAREITTLTVGNANATAFLSATQVLWANTTTLGCAAYSCPSKNNVTKYGPYQTRYITCQYSPIENYNGQQPFTVTCPSGKSIAANGLTCVASSTGTTSTAAKPMTTLTTTTTKASLTTRVSGPCFGGFSASGVVAILDAHNTIRTQVRLGTYQANGTLLGPANKLGNLTWSCSLAAAALQYAQQHCPYSPSSVPAGTLFFAKSVPQNMNGQPYFDQALPVDGTGITAFNTFVAPLKSQVVTTLTVGNANATAFLSATQVLWANTTTFGCATYSCPTGVSTTQYGPFTTRFITCQYSPIGNYYGQQPFTVTCPSGKNVAANGLTCA